MYSKKILYVRTLPVCRREVLRSQITLRWKESSVIYAGMCHPLSTPPGASVYFFQRNVVPAENEEVEGGRRQKRKKEVRGSEEKTRSRYIHRRVCMLVSPPLRTSRSTNSDVGSHRGVVVQQQYVVMTRSRGLPLWHQTNERVQRLESKPRPLYDYRQLVGPKARATYENRQKLQALRVQPSPLYGKQRAYSVVVACCSLSHSR